VNIDSNVLSIVDSTVAQRASARGRKIKMVSIGREYSGHSKPSLVTQAKENMTGLPRYLQILVGTIRFFGEFREKRSRRDRLPTKFEGKRTNSQLHGTLL
jgi:hypothetical protein